MVGRLMWASPMRLESDGLDTLLFSAAGISVASMDWGNPATRVVAEDAPDGYGSIDSTRLFGERVITAAVVLDQTSAAARSLLRAYMLPSRRSYLYAQETEDSPEVRVLVRGSEFSGQVPAEVLVAGVRAVVLQWVAPYGVIESAGLQSSTIPPADTSSVSGRTYDLEYLAASGRIYPASATLGEVTVVNAGNAPALPVVRMYGPVTDPTLSNDTVGLSLVFAGLTVTAGSYVEIDFRAKTILLNGLTSEYGTLDFPSSDWWELQPGVNVLRYVPATYSGAASAVVEWRDAGLGPEL